MTMSVRSSMILLAFALAAIIVALTWTAVPAWSAENCPPGAKSCKVLILTPEEENVLLQTNGIFDTAEKARFLDMAQIVRYFRDKIAAAPAGVVVPAETSK